MKRMILSLLIVTTLAALVVGMLATNTRLTPLPVVSAAEGTLVCSLSTLKGSYSVRGQGTVVAQLPNLPPPPFQFAEVSIANFDGAGNLSGKAFLNLNGIAAQGTFAGTYVVNSDCTGSLTLQDSLGIPVNESFVVLGNKGIREVDTDRIFVSSESDLN